MRSEGLRGIHVFWGISAFFGVMIAVQTVFVVQAIRTFPGEEVEKSYVQGLDYNETLKRRDLQRRMGWTAQAGLDAASALIVRLEDASATPLSGLSVMASVRRPGGQEKEYALIEQRPGEYVAATAATPGRLELAVKVRRKGQREVVFEAFKTVEVQ